MFSYTRPKPSWIKSVGASLAQSKVMLLALALFVLGVIIVRIITHRIQANTQATIAQQDDLIYPVYKERVKQQSNVTKLITVADALSKKKLFVYAALNFEQASTLDPNYRDAAYGWAYTLMQAHHAHLSVDDRKQLHAAIARVEAVDPLYVPLLQLKLTLAEVEKNEADKQLAQQRLQAVSPQK
jgi:hypothetical protein